MPRMARPLLLGIDVSTTGVKALLVDDRGTVVASEMTALTLSTPQPLWAEQQPEDWWQATVASVRRVLARPGVSARDIVAIGPTGQMHGLVLVDQRGDVLRPAILWNDQRTGAECDEIRAMVGRERLIQVTGSSPASGARPGAFSFSPEPSPLASARRWLWMPPARNKLLSALTSAPCPTLFPCSPPMIKPGP